MKSSIVCIGQTACSTISGRCEVKLAPEAILAAPIDAGLDAYDIDNSVRSQRDTTSEAANVSALELPDHTQMQSLDVYVPHWEEGFRLVCAPWRFDGDRRDQSGDAPPVGQNTRDLACVVLRAKAAKLM